MGIIAAIPIAMALPAVIIIALETIVEGVYEGGCQRQPFLQKVVRKEGKGINESESENRLF